MPSVPVPRPSDRILVDNPTSVFNLRRELLLVSVGHYGDRYYSSGITGVDYPAIPVWSSGNGLFNVDACDV